MADSNGTKKSPKKTNPADESPSQKEKKYDLNNFGEIIDLFREVEDEKIIKKYISEYISGKVVSHGLDSYRVIFLYDDKNEIYRFHSNQIYQAATVEPGKKDIFLVIYSGGGQIEPAYLISKTCKRLSKDKFIVGVPRRAKSAATLISLGADEIHMGLMSELGPIDPQIGGYPALGLSNALNTLARLACQFPDSADMFAKYLTANLNLRDLGYFERVNESASQYAERLLANKSFQPPTNAQNLANHFVNHYKDHGFVIDIDEAMGLLGDSIIKGNTDEYFFCNEMYSFLDFIGFCFDIFKKKDFYYVGGIETGIHTREKSEG